MAVVITKEFAIAAVEAEITRLQSEPCAFDEMHVVCAIEAIRRGDYDVAINHVGIMRRGPILEETGYGPHRRPLLCREKLRAMLAEIADRHYDTSSRQVWVDPPTEPPRSPPAPPSTHLFSRR